jgi:nitroreductase
LVILYLILFKLFSKILINYGNKRFDYNEIRFYILDQFFNSIREIKIFNLSGNYLNHFNSENLKYVRTNLFSSIIAVFTRKKEVNESEVDLFIENIMNTRGVPKELLLQYEAMMKGTINSLDDNQKSSWIDKQIYIALGFLLNTAAVIDVDTCPMEGFDRTQYDEILGLTDTTSVVVCALGYRDETDDYQNYKKVRKTQDELFVNM